MNINKIIDQVLRFSESHKLTSKQIKCLIREKAKLEFAEKADEKLAKAGIDIVEIDTGTLLQDFEEFLLRNKKDISEVVDYALVFGRYYKLNNKQIEYLIKAKAEVVYEEKANEELASIGLKITEEDKEGINEANDILTREFEEFILGSYGEQIVD